MKTFWDIHIHDTLCEVEYCSIGRPPIPWCERFASKITYMSSCWMWESAIGKKDCERNRLNFSLRSDKMLSLGFPDNIDACRWIYERCIGPIPDELQLDHWYCEDWRCVNPFHLEPVTNLENNQRYREIRRSWTLRNDQGQFAGRKEGAQ